MQPLRGRSVAEELEQPRRERAGDPERARRGGRVQRQQPRRRDGGAEHATDAGRVEPSAVERAVGGGAQARDRLAARHVGRDELAAGRAHGLGDGQRGRCDDGRDVADRARVRVVEVERVHQRAVGQRGAGRGRAHAGTDERRLRRAALGRDDGPRLAALAEAGGRVRAADRVEHVQHGALADCRRDVVVPERDRERRETLRRGHRPSSSSIQAVSSGGPSATSIVVVSDSSIATAPNVSQPLASAREAQTGAVRSDSSARQSARLSTEGPADSSFAWRAARVLDQRQVARHAGIDVGARERVVGVEERPRARRRVGGAAGAALEAVGVAGAIDDGIVLARRVRDGAQEGRGRGGGRLLQRAADRARHGQASRIVVQHPERVHAHADAVGVASRQPEEPGGRQHGDLAPVRPQVPQQHLAAVHRPRQVHRLRQQRRTAVARRQRQRAALRPQRLGVPPLLVHQVVGQQLVGRHGGSLGDAGQLGHQVGRVDGHRAVEGRLGQEALDVTAAGHRHPHLGVGEEPCRSPPAPAGAAPRRGCGPAPPVPPRGRARPIAPSSPCPQSTAGPGCGRSAPSGSCVVGMRAILSRMRVREPWFGRGGCLGTGRVEPPLEGNWMKTGWKKTIAPLVLVLGAVALAACGGSDNKTDSGAAAGTDAAAPSAGTLIIGTDLPLQGASADASADTNNCHQAAARAGRQQGRQVQRRPQGRTTTRRPPRAPGTTRRAPRTPTRTSPTRPRSPSWAPTTQAARSSRFRS